MPRPRVETNDPKQTLAGLPVECGECGYTWRTNTSEPQCPKCKSEDVHEID